MDSAFLAARRIVKFSVVGTGLAAVLLFSVMPAQRMAEVRPAPDTLGAEDDLELAKLAGAATAKPIRSAIRIYHPLGIQAIAFSGDGKYLATSGGGDPSDFWSTRISIWKTADWTPAGALKLEGAVAQLAFSPDGQFLYVAGGDRDHPILCRYQWHTEKRDRAYEGHTRQVDEMYLAPNGRTMITSGSLEDVLHIWDTTTGTIVRSFDFLSPRFAFAPQQKLLLRWSRFSRGYALSHSEGEKVASLILPAKPMAAAFTLDERFLLVAEHYYSEERGQEVRLDARRVAEGYRVVAETRFPSVWDDEVALAVSPDGRQVAVASGDVRLGMYTLPDLKLAKEFHFACRDRRSERIRQLSYSPDGKWLAAAREVRTTPLLFAAATGEEATPYEGHGDRVVDLRFSADDQTLRSVGNDGTVCWWDGATMKMLRRISLPAGHLPANIRPSDGRYALCAVAGQSKEPSLVVDLENGKTLCAVTLPVDWNHYYARLFWLNDSEALCTDGGHWWRFNYRTGKILATGAIDIDKLDSLFNGYGELAEDGTTVFWAHDRGKNTPPWTAEKTDLATMERVKLGEIGREHRPNGHFGLVPGGKYFRLGSYVFDRRTLKLVAAREFPGYGLRVIGFSPDGSRYAAMLQKARDSHAKTEALVRVQDTLTGRTVLAFTPPAAVLQFRFSNKGEQLAIAYDDGTLELRAVTVGKAK